MCRRYLLIRPHYQHHPETSHRYSAAIRPPAILSDAIWDTTAPLAALRSSVNTGMPASLAFWIEGTIASASVGLISRALTPRWIRSSMLVASLAGSSCASTTISWTPFSLAANSAPSFNVTKKGLLSADSDRPSVKVLPGGGSAVGAGVSSVTSDSSSDIYSETDSPAST